jgi:membrane-associated phospholipid phosphatase
MLVAVQQQAESHSFCGVLGGVRHRGLTSRQDWPAKSEQHCQADNYNAANPMQQIDTLIWAIIAAVALVVGAAGTIGPFHIDLPSYLRVATACALIMAIAGFYSRFRPDPKLASALTCTAQLAAFAATGAPLSYIAASAGLPLWDNNLVAWDRNLGFDWMAWLAAMNAHPNLHLAFRFAYLSFTLQAIITILALAFANHLARLRSFILGFMLAALVTIAISALMPAQGVWGQLHLATNNYPNIDPATQSTHLAVFHGLRDGSFRTLMALGSEGIIAFPSLHAALGLLFMVAIWPVPYLRWIMIVLNFLMIAATPIDGGHYFSDVIAGLAITVLCWLVATHCVDTRRSATADRINAANAPPMVPDTDTEPGHPGQILPQSDSRESLKAT